MNYLTIAAKFLWNNRKYIFILLFIMAIILLFKYKNDAARWENNFNKEVFNLNNAQILHNGEVAIYHHDLDSIRKLVDIRQKTVQVIYQTKLNYKDSFVIQTNLKDSINYVTVTIPKVFSIEKPCFNVLITADSDSIQAEINMHDELTGFLHWERPNRFLFIRWGAKQYFMKLHSACKNDTIHVNKLIIQE